MFRRIRNLIFKIIRKILSKTIYKKNFKTPEFFEFFFSLNYEKFIVQVGGNDGIQNDPLRRYLINPNGYKVVIFEPILNYFNKLSNLYSGRNDIIIKNFFISNESNDKKIYYLNPEICEELNGKNFSDNWAHGLGSFDKKSIEDAIDGNSFTDDDYKKNIPRFKQSIISEVVKPFQLKNLDFPTDTKNLLVVDVQGFELEVLSSLTFKEKIDFIVYEDEKPNSKKSREIRNLLKSNGYKIIGQLTWTDQIYEKNLY